MVPVVSGFSLSDHVFTAGPAPTPRSAQQPTGRPEGTTMRYTLSEDASVFFGIQRWRPGLLRGGRCQPVTRARGHRLRRRQPGRRCIALKPIAIFTRSGVAGANTFLFSGRVGTHALRPGRFDVGMDAIDAAVPAVAAAKGVLAALATQIDLVDQERRSYLELQLAGSQGR